jgi:hypothetical protein
MHLFLIKINGRVVFKKYVCIRYYILWLDIRPNIAFGTLVPLNFWDGFGQWTLTLLFGDCKMAVAIYFPVGEIC